MRRNTLPGWWEADYHGGETYPLLRAEFHAAVPEQTKRGRIVRPSHKPRVHLDMAYGRIVTADPEKLRAWAGFLHECADGLEDAGRGQLELPRLLNHEATQ